MKKQEYEGNCVRNPSNVIVRRRVFLFLCSSRFKNRYFPFDNYGTDLNLKRESDENGCSFMVSHLFCHYSIFISFSLSTFFELPHYNIFIISEANRGLFRIFSANMSYTRSSLTIVRTCLRQFVQSPFKGLHGTFCTKNWQFIKLRSPYAT